MKRRRDGHQDERRKARVEMNLVAERDGDHKPLDKARRGCSLPFLGGIVLLAAGLVGAHSMVG